MKCKFMTGVLIVAILTGCSRQKEDEVLQYTEVQEERDEYLEPPVIIRDETSEISEDIITIPALEVYTESYSDEVENSMFDLSDLNLGDLTVIDSRGDVYETQETEDIEVDQESCSHNYVMESQSLETSCDKDSKEVYKCTICNKEKTETIPAKGHEFSESVVEATCVEQGYTLKKCTRCGYEKKDNLTALELHTETLNVYQAPTCVLQGINEIKCSVCGTLLRYEAVDAIGHDWEKTKSGKPCESGAVDEYTCKNCKSKRSEPLAGEHRYGSWSVINKATCTMDGKQVRVCSICSYKEEQIISKEEHNLGGWIVETEATCTKSGKQTRSCSICNNTIETKTVKKLDHVFDWVIKEEATCTEEGVRTQRCARCMMEGAKEKIEVLGHSYFISDVKSAACEEAGYTNYRCSKCNDAYSEIIEPLGHTYNLEGVCIRCSAMK